MIQFFKTRVAAAAGNAVMEAVYLYVVWQCVRARRTFIINKIPMNKVNIILCVCLLCAATITAVAQNPVANFQNVEPGCEPYTVNFVNTSIGVVTECFWDFGDGSTSQTYFPQHIFAEGTYDVTLTVTGNMLTSTITRKIVVNPQPDASFNIPLEQMNGCQPLEVEFTNTSVGNPSTGMTYTYDFGDGYAEQVEDTRMVTHVYNNLIGYTSIVNPTLTATNEWGCISKPFKQDINIFPFILSDFHMLDTIGCSPLTVRFLNLSMGIEVYQYEFGDGYDSIGDRTLPIDLTHTFINPSILQDTVYNVTLKVSSGSCSDTKTQQVVVLGTPVADFRLVNLWPDDDCAQSILPVEIEIENLIPYPDRDYVHYLWTWAEEGMSYQHPISNDASPYPFEIPGWGVFNITMRVARVYDYGLYGICSGIKTLTIKKMAEDRDIFVQRWQDVLAVNNEYATNGGYVFTDYEWYKDGVKLPDTKGYIYEPGGLSPTAKYTAVLTTDRGYQITTCPAVISNTSIKSTVYPNLIQRGQTVHVETGMTSEKAVIQILGATGNLIDTQTLHDSVAEISIPNTPGVYILQITVNGTVETHKIVVE